MVEDRPKPGALHRVERAVAGSPGAETILNIFKAVLGTLPFTGGISSLITDYIPSSRFRRLEEFAQQVAEDLKRVGDRVNESELVVSRLMWKRLGRTFRCGRDGAA